MKKLSIFDNLMGIFIFTVFGVLLLDATNNLPNWFIGFFIKYEDIITFIFEFIPIMIGYELLIISFLLVLNIISTICKKIV